MDVLTEGGKMMFAIQLFIKKNNLMKVHQVVYTGGSNGIRVRDA